MHLDFYLTVFDVNEPINFIQDTGTLTVSLCCVNCVTSNTQLLSASSDEA